MITRKDKRHLAREHAIEAIFSWNFQKSREKVNNPIAREVIDRLELIDKIVESSAPEFPKERMNSVDLAILRLAVFELFIKKSEPVKVVIDEAIELAKEYGGENSPSFINGALGKAIKQK